MKPDVEVPVIFFCARATRSGYRVVLVNYWYAIVGRRIVTSTANTGSSSSCAPAGSASGSVSSGPDGGGVRSSLKIDRPGKRCRSR